MRWIASIMSSIRSLVSLRGTDRLRQDPVAQLRFERRAGYEIDWAPDEIAQDTPEVQKLEQTHRALEIDEQINIALLAGFIAGGGSKDEDRADAERRPLRSTGCQPVDEIISCHQVLHLHSDAFPRGLSEIVRPKRRLPLRGASTQPARIGADAHRARDPHGCVSMPRGPHRVLRFAASRWRRC